MLHEATVASEPLERLTESVDTVVFESVVFRHAMPKVVFIPLYPEIKSVVWFRG